MQVSPWLDRPTTYRYYQNGQDVTYYVMNNLPLPSSERFFEVQCR